MLLLALVRPVKMNGEDAALTTVRDMIFLLTATQPSAGSGKEVPEGGGEKARGEVAGFQNSESRALS